MVTPRRKFGTVDEYIKESPRSVRDVLQELRRVISESAPEAKETMSYGIPTFDLNGRHLVHFAAFKNHIGFYPTSSGVEAFKKELSKFKGGRGTVQFPLDEPIPFDLVRRITLFRVKENSKRSR